MGIVQFSNGHMYDISYVNHIAEYQDNQYEFINSWQKWIGDFDIDESMYDDLFEDLPEIPNDNFTL